MESHGEQNALSLHTRISGSELDLAHRETVAGVEGSVHVRVGHGAEELGVLLAKLGRGYGVKGNVFVGGCIGLEDAIFLPFLLILLLNLDERVSLLCLEWHGKRSRSKSAIFITN
jgi:hypothetical protein